MRDLRSLDAQASPGGIRTGWGSSAADTPGIGNCQNWTSVDSADRGAIARLTYDWQTTATAVSPWEASTFTCGGTAPVWCVQDVVRVAQIFLPVVIR